MVIETLGRKPSQKVKPAPDMFIGRVLDFYPSAPRVVDYALDLEHNFQTETVARVIEFATANSRESKIRIEFTNGEKATFRADKVIYRPR